MLLLPLLHALLFCFSFGLGFFFRSASIFGRGNKCVWDIMWRESVCARTAVTAKLKSDINVSGQMRPIDDTVSWQRGRDSSAAGP